MLDGVLNMPLKFAEDTYDAENFSRGVYLWTLGNFKSTYFEEHLRAAAFGYD